MHWTQALSQDSEVLSCRIPCLSKGTQSKHETAWDSEDHILAELQANFRELFMDLMP